MWKYWKQSLNTCLQFIMMLSINNKKRHFKIQVRIILFILIQTYVKLKCDIITDITPDIKFFK